MWLGLGGMVVVTKTILTIGLGLEVWVRARIRARVMVRGLS